MGTCTLLIINKTILVCMCMCVFGSMCVYMCVYMCVHVCVGY